VINVKDTLNRVCIQIGSATLHLTLQCISRDLAWSRDTIYRSVSVYTTNTDDLMSETIVWLLALNIGITWALFTNLASHPALAKIQPGLDVGQFGKMVKFWLEPGPDSCKTPICNSTQHMLWHCWWDSWLIRLYNASFVVLTDEHISRKVAFLMVELYLCMHLVITTYQNDFEHLHVVSVMCRCIWEKILFSEITVSLD